MDALAPWLDFAVAALATWRLSVFLVNEDGPFRLAARLRERLAGAELGRTFDCIACASLLVAIPVAFVGADGHHAILYWLALSGATILLERVTGDALIVERHSEPSDGV